MDLNERMYRFLEDFVCGMSPTHRVARELVEEYRATIPLPPELKEIPPQLA